MTVMHGVEHTVSILFNDVSKTIIMNVMIQAHKVIDNISGFRIYHNPHSIFKSKYY